jgi:peroxiredoxin
VLNKKVPDVIFKTRVRDETIIGDNPYRWEERHSGSYFSKKRVVLFSLPGAFTPTCSTFQLPDYDKLYPDFKKNGMDEIYCIAVNDAFVMNAWGKSQDIKNIQLIPDGAGEFTRKMGMLIEKGPEGFGMRSWRYAAVLNDGIVEAWHEEPGFSDNCLDDPYGLSAPQKVLESL